jgi:phosphatidylserine/phosphatidylglycerophosphate/cardiolipin synthase-like enzyme
VDLSAIATVDVERFAAAIMARRVTFPVSKLALESEGPELLWPVVGGLNAVGSEGALGILRAVLAERRGRSNPELVWTGPEARASAARDTAVVLAELFGRATTRILVAGFAFDHASEVLRPLHQALLRGVSCRLFADSAVGQKFLSDHWPFGPPFPQVLGFEPEAGVFASLHAKCVVIDGRWVFITSANFTDRGQTRNIEVGVVLDDGHLAGVLEAQFVGGKWFAPR